MKIQVVIEATTIEEYVEAIQALAAGYQVAPNPITVDTLVKPEAVTTYAKAKQAVESDVAAEEKPKRNRTRAAADKPVKEDKPSEDAAAPKTEEKAADEAPEAPKHGFPAVKLIAGKLSKIQDGKTEVKFLLDKFGAKKLSDLQEENYDEFHELASKAIADHDAAPSNDSVPESNGKSEEKVETGKSEESNSDDKAVTLEMIRSKAKELSVAGYKDEIKAALKEIGAVSLTKIPKDQYAAFYEKLGNL